MKLEQHVNIKLYFWKISITQIINVDAFLNFQIKKVHATLYNKDLSKLRPLLLLRPLVLVPKCIFQCKSVLINETCSLLRPLSTFIIGGLIIRISLYCLCSISLYFLDIPYLELFIIYLGDIKMGILILPAPGQAAQTCMLVWHFLMAKANYFQFHQGKALIYKKTCTWHQPVHDYRYSHLWMVHQGSLLVWKYKTIFKLEICPQNMDAPTFPPVSQN